MNTTNDVFVVLELGDDGSIDAQKLEIALRKARLEIERLALLDSVGPLPSHLDPRCISEIARLAWQYDGLRNWHPDGRQLRRKLARLIKHFQQKGQDQAKGRSRHDK